MAFTGMDIAGVRQLATQLDNSATQIDELQTKLTGTLGNTQWDGPDATAFRSEWNEQHSTNLRQLSERLRAVCTQARKNADEQERTSNA